MDGICSGQERCHGRGRGSPPGGGLSFPDRPCQLSGVPAILGRILRSPAGLRGLMRLVQGLSRAVHRALRLHLARRRLLDDYRRKASHAAHKTAIKSIMDAALAMCKALQPETGPCAALFALVAQSALLHRPIICPHHRGHTPAAMLC